MLILAEPQEILGLDLADQSQTFRTQPEPLPGHALSILVVVADA
jgi:hypothetical protein